MSAWRFFIADSKSMSVKSEITNYSDDKVLQLQLNKPGSFSCRMNIGNDRITDIEPLKDCIIAYKNGVAIWSGPIFVIQENVPSNQVSITANGWFELLNKRLLKVRAREEAPLLEDGVTPLFKMSGLSQTFENIDAGVIAWNLIERANSDSDTGIGKGDIAESQPRTRTYNRYTVLGQEIASLSSIESGFDWYITPDTKKFNVYYDSIVGSIRGKGVNRKDAVFGYSNGPDNVSSANRTIDGGRMVNEFISTNGNGTAGAVAMDSGSIGKYGLFTETLGLSDVYNIEILKAYAGVEVAYRAKPVETITFVPSSSSVTPSFIEDYDVGDIVQFSANYGRMVIPQDRASTQPVRVFGVSVGIDSNGIERLSEIQTSSAGQ